MLFWHPVSILLILTYFSFLEKYLALQSDTTNTYVSLIYLNFLSYKSFLFFDSSQSFFCNYTIRVCNSPYCLEADPKIHLLLVRILRFYSFSGLFDRDLNSAAHSLITHTCCPCAHGSHLRQMCEVLKKVILSFYLTWSFSCFHVFG